MAGARMEGVKLLPSVALLAACPALALLGCGGSSSSSLSAADGGGEGGTSATEATAALAKAYCARIAACAPGDVTPGFGQISTCESRFQIAFLPSFSAPGTSLTVAQASACAAALPGASCSDLLSRRMPEACVTQPGTLANGAACGADAQCVGTRCRVAPDAVCGLCATLASAGAACGVDADCQAGMTCLGEICTAYGDPGAACSATAPCRPDLGCVGGQCGTALAAGAPCTGDGQCDQLNGVYCNGLSKTCATAAFAQPGAPCGLIDAGLVECAGPGGLCSGVAAPTYQGTCLGFAADGQSCNADAGPLCDFEAVCAGGTCVLPNPADCK